MKLLLTRPAAQAGPWVRSLQSRGFDTQALPLIGIEPVPDPQALRDAWRSLARQALVVFVSPNAAEHFFAARPAGSAWPTETLAGSPGPGTTQVLADLGVPAAQLVAPADDAPQFDSESLWARLAHRSWAGRSVLIVRGDGGRDWLAGTLRDHGADVQFVAAYRRCRPQFSAGQRALLEAAIGQPQAHLWLFSSSEAITHLCEAVPGATWSQAQAIATHPRIAQTARAAGFGRVRECRPDLDALVGCIQSLANETAP